MKTRKQKNSRFHQVLLIPAIASLMFVSAAVQADDIEIYLTPPPNPVSPNVLFILDESGSMRGSKIEDLRDAMEVILNDPGSDNVTAGIMAYTTNSGDNGPLSLRAISDFLLIKEGSNRTNMIEDVQGLVANSFTPSVKALEAAVDWFKDGFDDSEDNIGGTAGEYGSPIGDEPAGNWCRPNHMVFLTDGAPNSNSITSGGEYGLRSYAGASCARNYNTFYSNGQCSREIASWAARTDLKTGGEWDYDSAVTGGSLRIQNVVTHTIGFGVSARNEAYLREIANYGTGAYYPATNAADLVAAFKQIFEDASTSIDYSYSSPTIPYNPDNAAVSDNFLYVPMFSPLANRYWKGNLKKYQVGLDSDGELFVRDQAGSSVVDSDFQFQENTQDYWTSAANSGVVYKGGAVSNMSDTTTRNLYTWLDDNPLTPDTVDPAPLDLTATYDVDVVTPDPADPDDLTLATMTTVTVSNRVHNDNLAITEELVAAGTPEARTTILNWANWIGDAPPLAGDTYTRNDNFPELAGTTTPDGLREYMGASIHTTPLVTRYNSLRFTDDDTVVDGANNSIDLGIAPPWSDGDLVVYKGPGLTLEDGRSLANDMEYKVITGSGTTIQLADKEDEDPLEPIDLAVSSNTGGQHSFTGSDAIDVVLLATSEGVLHAFAGGTDTVDTAVGDGGSELWSFMPRQFLGKINRLRENSDASVPDYGLDGPLTIYESGGKKYVVMTMRRGGHNIYALDITDMNKPKMAWEILGGSTTGYERLGQTWSEVQLLSMELNGAAARDVLVFGGGYDNTTQDPNSEGVIPTNREPDDVVGYDDEGEPIIGVEPNDLGNAIYVVDPATGERLAYFSADATTDTAANSLQVTGMRNGIIGILPVDINNNAITDRLYASGVGGRIFRIDIPDRKLFARSGLCDEENLDGEAYAQCITIRGGVIADINRDPGNEGFQRFFNKPEVAYYSRGGERFLGILIGSGYRPSPLNNTVTDRFYMIKDFDVFTVPSYETNSVITEGDLYDATENLIQNPLAEVVVEVAELIDDQEVCEATLPGDRDPIDSECMTDEEIAAYEADATVDAEAIVAKAKADLAEKKYGWYIDLLDGDAEQKVFSPARIFDSVILFSTYQGTRNSSNDVCLATSTTGQSNVYALNLLDGTAVLDLSNAVTSGGTDGTGGTADEVGVINSADRSISLNIQGLPPTPVIVFPDPGTGEVSLSGREAIAIVGLEAVFRFPDRFFPVNWEEIIDTEITPAQ